MNPAFSLVRSLVAITLFGVVVLQLGTPRSLAALNVLETAVWPGNGHTYLLLENSNWTEAEAEAVRRGSHLATMNSQAENDWLFERWGIGHNLWLGLNDAQEEGSYTWTSGETAPYRNWRSGEPNNGDYVYLMADGESENPGEWNDGHDVATVPPQPPLYGVVELESSPPLDPDVLAGPITNPANGHTYFLLAQNSWTDSQAEAVSLGGNLVTINDAAEQEWLISTFGVFGGIDRWLAIGLTRPEGGSSFSWVSGESVTYLNWLSTEPPGEPTDRDFVFIIPPSIPVVPGEWVTKVDLPVLDGRPVHGIVELLSLVAVFVDGVVINEATVSRRGHAQVSLFNAFRGTILYTLDGSDPLLAATIYAGPFTLRSSATLRVVAYNQDFSSFQTTESLEILILPTVSATTAGGGTVAIEPPEGAYIDNSTAIVRATTEPGWTFLNWLGDIASTNEEESLNMSRDRCVDAVFGTTVETRVVGSGSLTLDPSPTFYPYGTEVRLMAAPDTGNYFAQWGTAATGNRNPLSFTVTNANPTVTAVFSLLPFNQSALTVIPEGMGTLSTDPPANRHTNGHTVTLTATPEAGQDFIGWTGDATGTQNPLLVSMTASKVITARFTARPRLDVVRCLGRVDAGVFRLTVTGEFGAVYRIEASSNLVDWVAAGTVTNTYGRVQFDDVVGGGVGQRFYRAVQLP